MRILFWLLIAALEFAGVIFGLVVGYFIGKRKRK